jgi:hypothetical protein
MVHLDTLQSENSVLQTITNTNQSVATRTKHNPNHFRQFADLSTDSAQLAPRRKRFHLKCGVDPGARTKQSAKLNFKFKYESQWRLHFCRDEHGQTSASVSTISGQSMQNFLDKQFASLFQGTILQIALCERLDRRRI